MIPIIVIPAQSTSGREEDGPASACRQFYIESIREAGGLPLIVPLGLSESHWQQAYDLCNGILLTGGSDVSPDLYGESPHPKLGETIPGRDSMESWFVRKAFHDDRPLLGICRGIQIMNVALGGTLFQDLPDQFPSGIEHSSKGRNRWQKLAHAIEISADSKLRQILKSDQLQVNSLHHQAIKKLADGLSITAKAPDNITEAVEAINKKFFIGIQSHPEALWQNTEKCWIDIFKELVCSCR